MKKIVLFAGVCMLSWAAMFSQTVDENYADGRLYFKIKNDIPLPMRLYDNPKNVVIDDYSFLTTLSKEVKIKRVVRPFAAAKESAILQHTFELELVDPHEINYALRKLKVSDVIEYVEKVPLNKYSVAPNDPLYSSKWELTKINAEGAWAYSTGSTNVVVAIIDGGVETSHTDLAPNIWVNPGEIPGNGKDDDGNGYIDDINGYDVANNTNNVNPPNSSYTHGTMVAGMAAARTNNNIGIASIGYSIKIMSVQSSLSPGSISYGYDGIIYAAVSGADVINCSWGGNYSSVTAQNVIDYAYGKGCIVVAAAGNDGNSNLGYPASYNHVIAVSSTGSGDVKSSWSNFGSNVDISAPGENVYTTAVGGGYTYTNGTSFSSPLVAGLCGLMLSLNPFLTVADVETCLKNNADNIDAVNPSYVGQLGAGRINAYKTMLCVDATLALKPTTDFIANFTTVTAGGKVTFTDLTIHNPTSWNWTFTGGTPGTFVGKTPPAITYSTPGTYDVTLVTSNGNGPDTKLKTGYITVSAASGCDIVNYSNITGTSPLWHGGYYLADRKAPVDSGYVFGANGFETDNQKAQYFDATSYPGNKLTRVFLRVAKAYSANPNKIMTINVYDGTSGAPGALLGTTTKTIQQFRNAVLANKYVEIPFKPVITLPGSKKFFIGVDYSTLDWHVDTLAIVTNTHLETQPSGVWEQRGGGWGQMGVTAGTWGYKVSMYMFPYLTNQPVIATSVVTPTTICEGATVSMNAAGSTFQDTLLWFSPGGNPTISNSVSQSVIYNKAGSYITKLYVVGGGCHEVDSTVNVITVNPTPNISIASSNGTVLCPGSSTVLTASGAAGSYTWSPGTTLNTTSGPVVTANPVSEVNYNVSGSTAGCVGFSAINIKIDNPVSVSVSTTPSNATVCENAPVVFDATATAYANSYTWSFPGGTPSSSNQVTPSVKYAVSGTYTVTLSAANNCGTDNSFSKVVSVNVCTGVKELFSQANIYSVYNNLNKQLTIGIHENFNLHDQLVVKIVDVIGQIVYSGEIVLTGNEISSVIDLSTCSSGVYTIQLAGSTGNYIHKFVAE